MFLKEQFGYKKINRLYSSAPEYEHDHSFIKYLKLYFGVDIEQLLSEWEKDILNNHIPQPSNCNDNIFNEVEMENLSEDEILISYNANYPLSVLDNIIIYSENEMIGKKEMTKHKYLKNGKFKIDRSDLKSDNLEIYAHFYQYSQCIKIHIKK